MVFLFFAPREGSFHPLPEGGRNSSRFISPNLRSGITDCSVLSGSPFARGPELLFEGGVFRPGLRIAPSSRTLHLPEVPGSEDPGKRRGSFRSPPVEVSIPLDLLPELSLGTYGLLRLFGLSICPRFRIFVRPPGIRKSGGRLFRPGLRIAPSSQALFLPEVPKGEIWPPLRGGHNSFGFL